LDRSDVEEEVRAPRELGEHVRNEMFALFAAYYDAVLRTTFEEDLSSKDFVILLRGADRKLLGFSTLSVHEMDKGAKPVRYIFSGDTVMDSDYWGPGHLLRSWFHIAGSIKAQQPGKALYWLLLAKGHRTYRILADFFHHYAPRLTQSEDSALIRLRDNFARTKYGDFFDPRRLITFPVEGSLRSSSGRAISSPAAGARLPHAQSPSFSAWSSPPRRPLSEFEITRRPSLKGRVRNQDAWPNLAETCRGADAHFLSQCANLEAVQRTFLRDLAENAERNSGRPSIAAIANCADYAASVPVAPYEAFIPYIEGTLAGEPAQLTKIAPFFVETTGGSTSGPKIIPYTQGGLDAYWSAIRPWLADLLQRRNLREGRIYFALSPAGRASGRKAGVLPLGSPKRFAYFGSAATDLAGISIAPAELYRSRISTRGASHMPSSSLRARPGADWVWSPRISAVLRATALKRAASGDRQRTGPASPALLGIPLPARDLHAPSSSTA
jgi:hypothetical protein